MPLPLPTSRVGRPSLLSVTEPFIRKKTHILKSLTVDVIGWEFTVQEPNQKIFKKKVYADNFKYSPTKLRFVKTK